jgi:4-amino-4-deoxy-L-arabinose transferase-like glycosyltransferase
MSAAPADRRLWLAALLCAVAFSASSLFTRVLSAPDEIRVAEIGREMTVSGDIITPRLDREPFLEEPPLAYALVGGSLKVFGVSDAAARLPSALAAIATLMLAYALARRLGGESAGLLAVLVLGGLAGYMRYGTACMVDSLLALWVTLGFASALALAGTGPDGAPCVRASAAVLLHTAAGLAFLVKGLVGPGLLYGPLVIELVWHRRWELLRSRWHLVGMLVGAALVASWPLALGHAAPDLLAQYVNESVLGRFLPGRFPEGGHHNPAYYYLVTFPGQTAPWVLALPALACWLWRPRPDSLAARAEVRRVALLFPLGLLLLSVPATRRSLYLLPLLPAAAVTCAVWLAASVRRPDFPRLQAGTLLLLAAPFALLAELPARLLGAGPDVLGVRPLLAALRRRAPPHPAGPAGPRIAVAIFALVLVANLFSGRFQPDEDDMTPMATGLSQLGATGDALLGFRLDERTRAVVPFRTGALFDNLTDPDEVATRLAARPGTRLLLEVSARNKLPQALGARLQKVAGWSFGRHEYELDALPADAGR